MVLAGVEIAQSFANVFSIFLRLMFGVLNPKVLLISTAKNLYTFSHPSLILYILTFGHFQYIMYANS
jgi:hypothetical protein